MARPTIFTEELGREICGRLSRGASLRDIARDRTMPCISTITAWVVARADFYSEYMKARQCQAHVIADEILEEINNLTRDIPEGQSAMPGVLARKYKLDNLRWYLAKMLPREFAEKPLLALDAVGQNTQITIYLPSKGSMSDGARLIEGRAVEVEDRSED